MGRTVPVPDRDAFRQQALDGAPVEVCADAGIKLPQPSQEIEPPVSLLGHSVRVLCPGGVLGVKLLTLSTSASTSVDGEVSTPLLSPVVHNHLFSFANIKREVV